MPDVQGAIQPLFHHHPLGPHVVVDLIQSAVVRYSEVIAQGALGLDAQDPVQIQPLRDRPMQIRAFRRLHRKTPVVDRQIAR